MSFDLKKLLQEGINNVGWGVRELTGNTPTFTDTPTVIHEKHKDQTYGGYFNPQRNLISIVDRPEFGQDTQREVENRIMTHEMAHSDFDKGRRAFMPLMDDNDTFAPLMPDYQMRNLKGENPRLFKGVSNLLKSNIAYNNGYDLPQELYANQAERNRDIARMLMGEYVEGD